MIDILIPTVNRAAALPELVENVHRSTEADHRICFIMETWDSASIRMAGALDTVDLVGSFGSCAAAVNAGYQMMDGEFVAVANDDCNFHWHWDVLAMAYFNDEVHVVGLNDGSGDCKCFHLIRRAFIEQYSGVFDRKNVIYHEGYRSQCVDTEFSHYAQVRGVWIAASDSIVEHVHWRFGKADPDHPNYDKARSTNANDIEEYKRRQPEWDPGFVTPPCVPGGVFV